MGRAHSQAASTTGFDVLGRRGSPQAQAQRDQAERDADVRTNFMRALDELNYAECSRVIALSPPTLTDHLYSELMEELLRPLFDDRPKLFAALVQLDEMASDGSMGASQAGFLTNALCDWVTRIKALDETVVQALTDLIVAPRPAEADMRGGTELKDLDKLSFALADRLGDDRVRMHTPVKQPGSVEQAEIDAQALTERFALDTLILRRAGRAKPGTRGLDRLAPVLVQIAEDVTEGRFGDERLREIGGLVAILPDAENPVLSRLTAALALMGAEPRLIVGEEGKGQTWVAR